MADGTVFCDKNALYAASSAATAIGEEVSGQVSFGRADCDAAAGAHNGFWIQGNLRAAAGCWERNVSTLGEKITGVGTKLRETADAYHALDSGSAERFRGMRAQ